MTQPLSGIRILDLSRLLPGAYASQMLADFGADVVKVEEPGTGDYGRFMPPHGAGGMSLYFLAMNRYKRRPNGEPAMPPTQLGDLAGGSFMAVIGILAALVARAQTGEGRMIDVSM